MPQALGAPDADRAVRRDVGGVPTSETALRVDPHMPELSADLGDIDPAYLYLGFLHAVLLTPRHKAAPVPARGMAVRLEPGPGLGFSCDSAIHILTIPHCRQLQEEKSLLRKAVKCSSTEQKVT